MGLPAALIDRTRELLEADCPVPLMRVPDPVDVPGVVFDIERVAHVVGVAQQFVHIKGEWRGRPIELEPWQVQHIIAPVYGWVWAETGLRVRRYLFVELPRKNGKSLIVAVMSNNALVADGENAPEVYSAATSREQAREVYDPAQQMLTSCEALRGKVQSLKDRVTVRANGGVMMPVARRAAAGHGPSVHFVAVDELHLHRSPELIEAYESGTGSRQQPLVAVITTADEGNTGTVYDQRRREVEQLADGTLPYDPARYGVVFAAPATIDPLSVEAYELANPNIDVSVKREYLEAARRRAVSDPGWRPTYRRLHLGQRVRSSTGWLNMDRYAAGFHEIDWSDLAGLTAFGGLDLAAVDDFTALAWWVPMPGGDVAGVVRLFVSHAAVMRRDLQMQRVLAQWDDAGWLTITSGNATDFDAIRSAIWAGLDHLNVIGIGHDPWQSNQLATELVEQGVPMHEKRQTFEQLGAGASRLSALVLESKFATDGNPALRWMAGNTVPRSNPRDPDVMVPDKRNSGEKIDGITALVTAAAVAESEVGLPDIGLQIV